VASAEDLRALTISLSRWEIAGYCSLAAVAIGVIGEAIHDFSSWFKSAPWWRDKGNRASTLLLIVALVAELVIQVKTNGISGQKIAFLENEAADELARTAAIEKVASWRTIESTQARAIHSVLNGNLHVIELMQISGDPEAMYFSDQLRRLLRSTGLTLQYAAIVGQALTSIYGVHLWSSDAAELARIKIEHHQNSETAAAHLDQMRESST
jgi:hypothetical protein